MELVIIAIYGMALLLVCIFSFGQLHLALHYLRTKNNPRIRTELKEYPFVTVQLPIYNERYVVERLIDCISSLDYPQEKLEIQILDDSTDETTGLILKKIVALRNQGFDIKHLRRLDRTGYKAGALQYGLERSNGEFIAIFDADFLPDNKFLQQTLPYFDLEKIGMVQTCWGHINEDYSLLTKMQAFGLNAHFSVEQSGRQAAGSFINFNGTAGVWRKKCIEDAGGWQFDTLTEDLDLSYRAQLKGWKFEYLEDVKSPAELPVFVPAIKSQQYRWNKGAAETARKILGDVLRSNLTLPHKTRAVLHLLNSSVFLFMLIAAILSIPMLYIKAGDPTLTLLFNLGSIFISGFIAIGIFYWVSARASSETHSFRGYIIHFPLFLTFSMGLALHNSIAILEGWFGVKTPFVRTPKFNIVSRKDSVKHKVYLDRAWHPLTLAEGLLTVYFIFGIISGFRLADFGLVLFHLMLAAGFGFVFLSSLRSLVHAK